MALHSLQVDVETWFTWMCPWSFKASILQTRIAILSLIARKDWTWCTPPLEGVSLSDFLVFSIVSSFLLGPLEIVRLLWVLYSWINPDTLILTWFLSLGLVFHKWFGTASKFLFYGVGIWLKRFLKWSKHFQKDSPDNW